MSKGWLVLSDPCEIIPEGDLLAHGGGLDCLCEPRLDGDVIVHHAFDQREDDERGGLRPVAGYATFDTSARAAPAKLRLAFEPR